MPSRPRRHIAAALLTACATLAAWAPGAQAEGLTLGLTDPVFDPGAAPAVNASYGQRATAIGVRMLRVTVLWRDVAPVRPTGDAGDPASPTYRFAPLDAAVRAAAARGMSVLLLVAVAPSWAQGANRPADVPNGAWRPDADAFGAFMHAVAARYAGTFDPGDGGGALPFITGFQLWNEPNLTTYLAPQWRRGSSGRFEAESPEIYRHLVNAAYPQIKAASPRALVVAAGTAPYGDPVAGNQRMPPARFERELLCESGTSTRPRTAPCPDPVHLDVFTHHPYGVGDPFEHGIWPDDVTLAELDRLARIWSLAERSGRVLPPGHRRRWVTEFGWESKPDPTGLAQSTQAAWLGQALYRLEAAGFDTALWYHVRDDGPVPSWGFSSQSGLYTRTGKAKAAAAMFAFPVAAIRRPAGKVRVFAVPPASGTCVAQKRTSRRWVAIARGRCTAATPWLRSVRTGRKGSFRVRIAGRHSPAVRVAG